MVNGNVLIRVLGLCLIAGLLVAGLLFPAVGGQGLASNQASDTVTECLIQPGPKSGAGGHHDHRQGRRTDRLRVRPEPVQHATQSHRRHDEGGDYRHRGPGFLERDEIRCSSSAKALMTNLSSSGGELEGQGASTLTMQYIKNYMLYAVAQNDAERAAAEWRAPRPASCAKSGWPCSWRSTCPKTRSWRAISTSSSSATMPTGSPRHREPTSTPRRTGSPSPRRRCSLAWSARPPNTTRWSTPSTRWRDAMSCSTR